MTKKLSFAFAVILALCTLLCACGSDDISIQTTASDTGLKGDVNLDVDVDLTPTDETDLSASLGFELPERDFNVNLEGVDIQAFLNDAQLNFSEEDLAALQNMDPAEIAKLIQVRANLLADLEYAFEKTGVSVHIDERTGEINLDATVLFDVDEYAVSDEGKNLLKTFMEVYTFVVYHERYNGFISNVLIEGHTDSTGEYAYNQALSQKRADAVMNYILSDDCGLSPEHREAFGETVTAKGFSWDRLIYDENGVEDKDASRRVCFRFLIEL